jgi:outer membrane protein
MKVATLIAPLAITALTAASLPAQAYEAGDLLVRVGPTMVNPGDKSGEVLGNDGVEADDNTQLGLTLSYMLSDSLAVELLAATPFDHDVTGNGDLAGTPIGSLKHLPPTVSILYYPMASDSAFQPYLGVGLNYTLFFDTDMNADTAAVLDGLLGTGSINLDVDDSVGLAFKVGADYSINENWGLSAGIYYIDIDTTAILETENLGNIEVDVEVDPMVYMLGVNYKF